MAGHRWLVPSARGLLLCILALQLCLQGSLATAGHSTAANTMVMATKNTPAATKNTPAATKNTPAATKNTPVATKNTLAGAVTTKKASLVAVTTKNTLVATRNAAVVPVAKTAMVVATTKKAAVVATATTSVATKNSPVTAKATKNSSAATETALVVVATTKEPSVATGNTSVVATNNATEVATNNASLVATNTSMKGAEETMQTCQSFQCSGERCYQDEAHANGTTTCHNESYCELYRFSSTNYTAGCSSGCSSELCSTNGSVGGQRCALECCSGPLCLQLNATAYGDLPPATTTTVPPTTTTTTPRPPPQNGKVCAAFSCHGNDCFKGRKTTTKCILGQDFCEMKRTGSNYVAGCSKACKAAKPVCAGGVKAACYQECCPATPKGSCLKLDGKVHVNSAGQAMLAPFLKVVACGVALLLSYRGSASLWG